MHRSIYAGALLCALAVAALFSPDHAFAATAALQTIADHGNPLLAMAAAVAGARYERKEDAPVDAATAIGRVLTAFEEYKATNDNRLKEIEKKGSADPLTEAKLARIEAEIAKGEGINAAITAAANEARAAKEEAAELKGQVETLQTAMRRTGSADPEQRKAETKAARNLWARGVVQSYQMGEGNLSPEQRKAIEDVRAEYKALSVADDTTGGYLAPVEYVREIIKGVTETSPIRSLVRVRTTASKAIEIPKRTASFSAVRVAEQGTRSETDGLRYGMVEITAPEAYALIDISQQNLEDSAFDLESEISSEAIEQFAVLEGYEGINGSGVGAAEGILTNASVASTNSGSALVITADGLLTLKHAIKTDYARNATFILNRTTLGSIRKLKDGNGQYLWMPGLAMGKPNTIDGDPYVEMPDMPSEGANTYPVAYGDFRRAYTMLDRVTMSLLRDPYTQATSGNIRFLFRRRFGGAVVLAEAIRKLKCST